MADANPVQANPQEEPETTKRHGKTRGVRVRGKDAGTKPSPETAARAQSRPLHRAGTGVSLLVKEVEIEAVAAEVELNQ